MQSKLTITVCKDDVKATFAAFRRLDVGNYGTLNSRTVREGEIWRIRSCKNLAEMAAPQPLSPRHRSYSADDSLELSQASVNYNPYSYVMHQSPNPYFNPNPIVANGSHRSLQRLHSSDQFVLHNTQIRYLVHLISRRMIAGVGDGIIMTMLERIGQKNASKWRNLC